MDSSSILIPIAIFAVGCVLEYNTGTIYITTIDPETNATKIIREYSSRRGYGLGWGFILAVLAGFALKGVGLQHH